MSTSSCGHSNIVMMDRNVNFVTSEDEAMLIWCADCGQIRLRTMATSQFHFAVTNPLTIDALNQSSPECRQEIETLKKFLSSGT